MFQVYLFIPVMIIILMNIWAVIDISKYPYKLRRKKWLWTNIVLFFPLFGVFIYLFMGKGILNNEQDANA